MVVVGGGPAGATAAADLARRGRSVLLLDRAGRIKPCGGAIPPRLIRDFAIPDGLLVARVNCGPHGRAERRARSTCRSRAASSAWSTARCSTSGCASGPPPAGAVRRAGTFERLERDAGRRRPSSATCPQGRPRGNELDGVRARAVIGADGAKSQVCAAGGAGRRQDAASSSPITRSSARREDGEAGLRRRPLRRLSTAARISPDFYAWVFPHGEHHQHRHRHR